MTLNKNQSLANKPIKNELNSKGKNISPFVSNGDTFRSANKTSYDLTNPNPAGGPINSPKYNYSHTYTPNNTYLNKFGEAASPNSGFGIEGDKVQDNSIFKSTELDIENSNILGGPNRTNSNNIPNGTYNNIKSGNLFGNTTAPQGGPLKNLKGNIINSQLNEYSPNKKYLDDFSIPQPPLPIISPSQPTPPSGPEKELINQSVNFTPFNDSVSSIIKSQLK